MSEPLTSSRPPPGSAGSRLDYGLKERAMRGTKVPEGVRKARKEMEDAMPDVLGSRHGNAWNPLTTVNFARDSKFGTAASDIKLSNSLYPGMLSNTDIRRRTSPMGRGGSPSHSTHTPKVDWGTRVGSGGSMPSSPSWNPSAPVTGMDPREMQRIMEETIKTSRAHSVKATWRLLMGAGGGSEGGEGDSSGGGGGYITPIRRQEMIIEEMRELKMNPPERKINQLLSKYGEEGAEHMKYIIELRRKKDERKEQLAAMGAGGGGKQTMAYNGGQGSSGVKPSKVDLEAVQALPLLGLAAGTPLAAAGGIAEGEDDDQDKRRAGGSPAGTGMGGTMMPLPPWRSSIQPQDVPLIF